jgi:PAS domain-containing protein
MDTTVLAALLEYSPNPTWLADCDGRYANQELREATALSEAQLGDLNWLELVTQEGRQMSFTLWQEARIHHQPYRARFFVRTKDCARVSAVDAVGTGHIAPDGSEVWPLYRRLNAVGQSASANRDESSSDPQRSSDSSLVCPCVRGSVVRQRGYGGLPRPSIRSPALVCCRLRSTLGRPFGLPAS